MLELKNFEEAKKRVDEVVLPTPLIYSPAFSKESRNTVYIKPENLQRTGAFKIRGAYNKIMKMDDESKSRGLIASSAGNHAQGVAYAAQQLGVKATIVMPAHTPLIKVDATKALGAEVVLHGEVYDNAYNKAVELQKEHGYTFVHPFDDEDVIEGQGTIALEILEELPDADIILVPVGGGGLISGIACAAKLIKPTVKIIGVEPEDWLERPRQIAIHRALPQRRARFGGIRFDNVSAFPAVLQAVNRVLVGIGGGARNHIAVQANVIARVVQIGKVIGVLRLFVVGGIGMRRVNLARDQRWQRLARGGNAWR